MRRLCNEHIVTAEGVERINFNRMIVLNESAAFLWSQFEDGREFTVEDLAGKLVEKYGIDLQTALRDSAGVAARWEEVGLVAGAEGSVPEGESR